MGYIIRLTDFSPPALDDDAQPFVSAQVEELIGTSWTPRATTTEGVTTPETPVVFADPDDDPSHPALRSFTTEEASAPAGRFRVVFLTADGNVAPSPEVLKAAESVAVPSIGELATHMLSMTREPGGRRLGYFTDRTPVTAIDAERAIALAAMQVWGLALNAIPAGVTMTDGRILDVAPAFRSTTALLAAIYAWISVSPELTDQANAPTQMLEKLYELALKQLRDELAALGNDGELPDDGTGAAGASTSSYAQVSPYPTVGWGTAF